MISAVLFDLDGTLLDISLERFFDEYFALLGPVIAALIGADDVQPGLTAVMRGTEAMYAYHPQLTNQAVFDRVFAQLTGFDLGQAPAAQRLADFYEHTFPRLKGDHGPRQGAQGAVETARALGLKTVLATNPIFPLAAITERARWAGLEAEAFDLVTSYETSRACKPSEIYFLDIAEALGVRPEACLMVGDDRRLDVPARHVGMRTFYVGKGDGRDADWCGTLDDLERLLRKLNERR